MTTYFSRHDTQQLADSGFSTTAVSCKSAQRYYPLKPISKGDTSIADFWINLHKFWC
ncbi:hypothetical protein [Paraglaciecola mesophila]|uniref:hypothetical protein n=1 Tax=Paraglaciecola mesophila TaxID=197222 RepID=UPI001362F21E|nr:hypothetical protein [Paraglaciecola mesophila]